MRAHGLRPRKELGQNFLIDRDALAAVVDAARVRPGDTILEIGPGIGTLTGELAARDAGVIAVELDEAMARVVETRALTRRNVTVVRGNVLHMDLDDVLPPRTPYKVVANIPYYITAPILRLFLEAARKPELIVLMVQREVAERLAARAGRLSILGVTAQFYARVEIVRAVPASSFMPPPEVDSAIVRLTPYAEAAMPAPVDDPDRFFGLVKAGFGEKRKQLHNALAHNLAHIPAAKIDAALAAAGIERTRRAETVMLEEWAILYALLDEKLGKLGKNNSKKTHKVGGVRR